MGAVAGFLPGLPRCHARNGVAHGVLGMDAAAGFLPALPRMPCPGGDGARECLGHGCRRRFPAGFAPLSCPEWDGAGALGMGAVAGFLPGLPRMPYPGGDGARECLGRGVPSEVSCRACPAVMPGMGWRTGSWAWMPPQVSCRLCPACRAREGMARGSALGMGAVAGFLPALPRMPCPEWGGARGPGHGCRRRFPAGFAPHAVPVRGMDGVRPLSCRSGLVP